MGCFEKDLLIFLVITTGSATAATFSGLSADELVPASSSTSDVKVLKHKTHEVLLPLANRLLALQCETWLKRSWVFFLWWIFRA